MQIPDFSEAHRAIGHFTCNWASLEMALDSCNVIFYQRCGGRKRIDKHLPRSLAKKLRFFRLSLKKLPVLADYRAKGIDLAARVGALKRDRHDAVHGYMIGWNPETKLMARSIFDIEKTTIKTRDHTLTVAQIDGWAIETGEIAIELLTFGSSLIEGIVKPQNVPPGSS